MVYSFIEKIELGQRNALTKARIIGYYIQNGANSLADLGRDMDLSVPTITKLVNELIDEGFVIDFGKQETDGGRRPNIYGINPTSGYFIGVDIKQFNVNLALINFSGDIIELKMGVPFAYEQTETNLDELITIINGFIESLTIDRSKILNAGISISGRVDAVTGRTYSRYTFDENPLGDILQNHIGIHFSIDNDSRAMTYGEYINGVIENESNMLFINVSWGLGLGLIIDGKLYYGKSGFAGEFGHVSTFNNEIICHCGKKGCLETQASGSYIHRRFFELIEAGNSSVLEKQIKTKKEITLDSIINAAHKGDMLSIDIIEEVGNTLGKHIAGLINILNPELVVIGGTVVDAGDYLLLPIRSSVKKYSLNLASKDVVIKPSKLGNNAGVLGACMLSRAKLLKML